MAAKENFLKAHWDWLVAGAGLLLLALSAAVLVMRLGISPVEAAADRERSLSMSKPSHEGVAPADMTLFRNVMVNTKSPPSVQEIDPAKGSFLASETRIVCKAENDAVGKDGKPIKGCGRPIPIASVACPFCGVVQDTGITKEEEGEKLKREWSLRYGVDLAAHPDADSDGDGFTDMEEFEFASSGGKATNPKDPESHPDYLDSLFVDGQMRQNFLPFYLSQATKIPAGWRFYFRDASNNKLYGKASGYLKGEEIGNTGFSVESFETKTEERLVKGSKNGLKKTVDASTAIFSRKGDGKKIEARIRRKRIPVDRQVALVLRRGGEKQYTVRPGDVIEVFSRKYRIESFGGAPQSPEVVVTDMKSGTKSVISQTGRKRE